MERLTSIVASTLTLTLLIILLMSPELILPSPVGADFANVTSVSLVYAWTNITGDTITIGATTGYKILQKYLTPSSDVISGDAGTNQTLYDKSILLISVSLTHIYGNTSIWKYSASSWGASVTYEKLDPQNLGPPEPVTVSGDAGAEQVLHQGVLVQCVSLFVPYGIGELYKGSTSSYGSSITWTKYLLDNFQQMVDIRIRIMNDTAPPEVVFKLEDAGYVGSSNIVVDDLPEDALVELWGTPVSNNTITVGIKPSSYGGSADYIKIYIDGVGWVDQEAGSFRIEDGIPKADFVLPEGVNTITRVGLHHFGSGWSDPTDVWIWDAKGNLLYHTTVNSHEWDQSFSNYFEYVSISYTVYVITANLMILDIHKTVGNHTIIIPVGSDVTPLFFRIYLNASEDPVLVYETFQNDTLYGNIKPGHKYVYSQTNDHFFIVSYMEDGITKRIAFPFGNNIRELSIFADNITITRETVSQAFNHSTPTSVYNQPGGVDLQLYVKAIGQLLKIIIQNQDGGALLSEHQSGFYIRVLNYSNLYPFFEGEYVKERSLSIPLDYPEILVSISYKGFTILEKVLSMTEPRVINLTLYEESFCDPYYNTRLLLANASFSKFYTSDNWLVLRLHAADGRKIWVKIDNPYPASLSILANVSYTRVTVGDELLITLNASSALLRIHDPASFILTVTNPLGQRYPEGAVSLRAFNGTWFSLPNSTSIWLPANNYTVLASISELGVDVRTKIELEDHKSIVLDLPYLEFLDFAGNKRKLAANNSIQVSEANPKLPGAQTILIISGPAEVAYLIPALNDSQKAILSVNVTAILSLDNQVIKLILSDCANASFTTLVKTPIMLLDAYGHREIPIEANILLNGTSIPIFGSDIFWLDPGNFTLEVPDQISGFKFVKWEDGLRQKSRTMTNYANWVSTALYSAPSSLKIEVTPSGKEAEIKITLKDYFGAVIPNAEISIYTSIDMATWKLLGKVWTDENGVASLKLYRREFDYYVKAEFAGIGEELQQSSATAMVPSLGEEGESPTEEVGMPAELVLGIVAGVGALIAVILGIYKVRHAIPERHSRRVLRPIDWMLNAYIFPVSGWRRKA
ncbi:MAG: hypothetical protein DRJ38_01965 [Thermoprotei archaeon]|nr:MAG: hypothetical protein DRJ38_01965 [Thermoprotei archaeon]